jgi:hypothetical protein
LRLSDIYWWMRLLSQRIAQRANRDDQEVGKFWQARYRATRLLDETSLLACAAYVDLNPIRAALAQTLETSDFTSVQKRIESLRTSAQAVAPALAQNQAAPRRSKSHGAKASPIDSAVVGVVAADRFLAPLTIDERADALGACAAAPGAGRASHKGFLPMSAAEYVTLLDWTARQIRSDKPGSTPTALSPIFQRLKISEEVWCELARNFGRLFYVVAGQPQSIDSRRTRSGRRHKTRVPARELMAESSN